MRLLALFLALALPLGLMLARLVPPGEVPDETAHAVRAYAVASGQWLGHRAPVEPGNDLKTAGYQVDTGLFGVALASTAPGGWVSAALQAQRDTTGWSGRTVFASVPNTASYAPILYIVSGGTLAAGRAAGLGPAFCMQLARVANLLAYALLGVGALIAARRMRLSLLALLCLPSSLSLAASLNQDGLVIGLAVLAAALLTRGDRIGGAIALAVVSLAKPPYLPLVGLLLVPPGAWAWRPAARGAGLAALAALPGVAWSLVAMRLTVVPFTMAPYAPGPLYSGPVTGFTTTDSAAQVAILLAEPSQIVSILWASLRVFWNAWAHEVVGVLGQLSLELPRGLYITWFAALALAVVGDMLSSRRAAARWTLPGALVVLGVVAASGLLVCTVQYLTWTHVGADTIAGVQGRYFVPLLAALALAVPGLPAVQTGLARLCAAPLVLAGAGQFVAIPALVVRRWYLG